MYLTSFYTLVYGYILQEYFNRVILGWVQFAKYDNTPIALKYNISRSRTFSPFSSKWNWSFFTLRVQTIIGDANGTALCMWIF